MRPAVFEGTAKILFDAIPAFAFAVDEDLLILDCNAAATALLSNNKVSILRQRGGEALQCIHADDLPEGCGRSEACKDCVVRNAVNLTFTEGTVARKHTSLQLVHGARVDEIHAVITTSPLLLGKERRVLLQIEDIGKLKVIENAEIALRESEAKYKIVVETASEGIWVLDAEFRTNFVNPRMAEMLGYEPKEMLARPINTFIGEEDAAKITSHMELRAGGNSSKYEQLFRRKDGSGLWTFVSGTPLLDPQGLFNGAFAMISDISERKRIEKALYDTKVLLKKTFESLNEAIFIVETVTRKILDCNSTVEKMFGYSRDEVIGNNTSCLHISAEMSQRFGSEMQSAYVEKGFFETTFVMRRKDGTVFASEHSVTPIRDDRGTIISHVCVVRDISERKCAEDALRESEERYRAIVNAFDGQIYICSPDYRILFMNENLAERTCRTAVTEPCYAVLHDRKEICPWCVNERVFKGETVRWELQSPRDHRWYYVVNTPIHNSDGTLSKQAMILDITERKKAEVEIIRLNNHLEQLVSERTKELALTNRDLSSFCYAISHELRAPVARLKGFSQILREGITENPDEAMHCVERIALASSQLQRVIDAVLQLSRLAQASFVRQSLSLSDLARETAIEMLSNNPDRKLQVVIADGITATGDPKLLRLCLGNLFENALKYSVRKATAQMEFGWDAARSAMFVRDNGIGFDMDHADKIFEPFVRLHREEEFPGSGIGLATVQRIIERHDGRIWAEAAPNQGATFYFILEPSKEKPA